MKIQFAKWPYGARCAFTTSWDDGYATDLKVLKILEKNNVKGTFFISSKLIGEEKYLDYQEIRDIVKNGHEIGSHAQTHQKLHIMGEKQVLNTLVTSKDDLEELIGKEIFGFAYPFGCFDKRIKELVKLANYKYARTTKFGTVKCPPRDWFEWNPSLITQGRGGYRKKILRKSLRFMGLRPFYVRGFPRDWVEIAHYIFKNTYTKGGLFHLWGHSGSLCEKDDLKRLDRLLLNISNFSDIWFARNIDIFFYEMTKRYTSIRINKVTSKKSEIVIEINPKIKPSVITLEIDKPDRSMIFRADHLSIQKRYQGKTLFVTFSPLSDK